ncbi:MAG: BON domain-containing protein [Pyrinomonadaceae bacterium]
MKRKIFFVAALAVGIGVLGNTVSAQVQMNGGESRIERKVRSEILSLPYYGVFDAIGYTTNGSTVTLNGFVVRPITKSDAEGSVKDIEGVERVVNNIEVLPLSPNDDRIRLRTLNRLSGQGGSLFYYFLGTNPSIRIIVKSGRIQLEGFVNNKADSNLANILARVVTGTFGVTNNLQILKGEPR